MFVTKRNGSQQEINLNKITQRINYLINGTEYEVRFGDKLDINAIEIAKDVCGQIKNGITTSELDEIAADICAYKSAIHPKYDTLAARLIISNHQKENKKYKKFSDMMHFLDEHNKTLSSKFMTYVELYKEQLDKAVEQSHFLDFRYLTYFGFKTLKRSYLMKAGNTTEFVQHMFMRVSLDLNRYNLDDALECYKQMSNFGFIHATPTLFNSGTIVNQYSSCFLMGMDDSIDGMYGTMKNAAQISKWAGGIGIWVSKIRATGSIINSTKGTSSGVTTLIKVYNEFAKHVNQGGRRKGSVSIYVETWHADIVKFLNLKRIVGKEEDRARDLFYALFICDLFMKRLKEAIETKRPVMWSLMCPYECPGLADTYGEEFETLYKKYESESRFREQINIETLWKYITDSQLESSLPYMIYKDHVNNKSNQKNVGIIRSSNLCAEIVEYSNPDEYAVCNLASICVQRAIQTDQSVKTLDTDKLIRLSRIITKNLNRAIDQNYYTCIETMQSNLRHRPTAIGVQGLAELFFELKMPYESQEAQLMNKRVFETIYFGALTESIELAKNRSEILIKYFESKWRTQIDRIKFVSSKLQQLCFANKQFAEECHDNASIAMIADNNSNKLHFNALYDELYHFFDGNIVDGMIDGTINMYELQYLPLELCSSKDNTKTLVGAYSTFINSPAYHNQLQFDMWNTEPSTEHDWPTLKKNLKQYGMANSLLTSLMPTASTAQIMGSTESFEPITSNIYSRVVLSGNFMVTNKYLINDLIDLGLWNNEMKNKIIQNRGSIAKIDEIPQYIREIYKTAWEISKKTYIKMSADRGAFIDQSQSLNLFIANPDQKMLTQCHMYGWEQGLKTGMYYLRRKAIVDAQQFTQSVTVSTSQKHDSVSDNKQENKMDDLLHDKLKEATTPIDVAELERQICGLTPETCQMCQ